MVFKPYAAGTSKIILGKAFRAPSTCELFYNDGGTTQEPSPDLSPEEVWSLDLEHCIASARPGRRERVSTSHVRRTSSSPKICPIPTPMTALIRHSGTSTRRAPLATTGAELRLRREWAQGWMFEVSYSLQVAAYLSSEDLGALLTFDRSPLYRDVANVPGHMAAIKGAVPIVEEGAHAGHSLDLRVAALDRARTRGRYGSAKPN